MYENRVLRKVFGPKRVEVAGGSRRLHKEELHNLHASPNTIMVIKSRMMRWVNNIEGVEEMRHIYVTFWSENLMGRYHSEDRGVDWSLML
jgi:hypothetical protein